MSTERIGVDQTLHGYSEGHRLIEGSLKLPQLDARMMLVLSDASSSSSRIPSEGYLTGYPLAESGKYVLARTWAALEMSRPGCVWTHSLLIDFADLARLGSAAGLIECFRRPAVGRSSGFTSRLDVEVTRVPTAVPFPDLARVGQWASALYGKPKGRIVAEREGPDDDGLVMAIWMQQWPRLRRAFRFCSFSADDRSTSVDVFDLQLVDGGRSNRLRFPGGVLASTIKQDDWINTLLNDLELPARSDLRQFLRDVGSDVANGRAAMIPLIHLHTALRPDVSPVRLADAIADLELLGAGQGRMGRAAAARVVLSRSGLDDLRLFDFALQQVQIDRDLLGVDPAIVGRVILRWRPDLLAEGVSQENPLHRAIEAALPEADIDELMAVISAVPSAVAAVIPSRSDVLEHAAFWQIVFIDAFALIRSLDLNQDNTARIISALVEAGRDDCSLIVVKHFGIGPVVIALSRMNIAGIRARVSWVRAIASQTNAIAEGMATGRLSHRPLLFVLTEVLEPDAIPNCVGTDPWVTAVECTRTTDDVSAEDQLAAFLFNRARGRITGATGRLFFLSVQRLHEAMVFERLNGKAWRMVRQRLPYGSIWRDWGQCEKLRHAVVDTFIDRELPPIEFGIVVEDDELWEKLVDFAADSSRGRRYLRKVRSALCRSHEVMWVERGKLIDCKIG